MAIAPGQGSADPAETPDGERVIVPTSIYAPGARVDAPPGGDGSAAPPGYSPPPGPGPVRDASAHRPASTTGAHPYGDYAYVIRQEEAPAPPPPRPRATGPGTQPPVSQPAPQEPPTPEPPAPPAEAATVYGPDDPAYGPPSPEWYSSEDQAGQEPAEELQPIRGIFEPPQNQGESGALGALEADLADGTPPLERIRDFYLSAEAISTENLDRHFDELLERQRQLISAYFTEAPLQEDPR
jgi:hypothetical protein